MNFSESLDPKRQYQILDHASYNITPDIEIFDNFSTVIVDALCQATKPIFVDRETVAYAFQALFNTQNIEPWLDWLATEINTKSNGEVSLKTADKSDIRRALGGAIKGDNVSRLLTKKDNDQFYWIVTFGPYRDSVELRRQAY